MTEYESGLTVLALQGENVKRVRAVRIIPPRTGVVKIAGKNGVGKSSTLDLIPFGLGGARARPAMPIRRGATNAKEVVELQDAEGKPALRVTLTWTGKGEYLTVDRWTAGKWAPIKGPQEFLDSIVGAGLGFDPLAFMRLKPAQQVDTLLGALKLAEDPRAIDAERAQVAEERTGVNRETKALRARVEVMPEPGPDVPDAEVSVTALMTERDALAAQREAFAEGQRKLQQQTRLQDSAAAAVDAADREVGRLREVLAQAETLLGKAKGALVEASATTRTIAAAVHALPNPSLDAVTAQISAADGVNRAVRVKLERQRLATELDAKKQVTAFLTTTIDGLDERKRTLLTSASFPVPGLGFELVAGAYAVTLGGVPLEQISQSEQIRVGVALAMALAPRVRVILIRDGSLLDVDTLVQIEALAGERGYQVWTEIVGPDGDDAFVIEDGGVIREPVKGA